MAITRGFSLPESMSDAVDQYCREEGFEGFSAAVQQMIFDHLKHREGEIFMRMRIVHEEEVRRCQSANDTKSGVRKNQTTGPEAD